eukprot:496587_1
MAMDNIKVQLLRFVNFVSTRNRRIVSKSTFHQNQYSSSTHHSFSAEKLALNVGNKASIEHKGKRTECVIKEISYVHTPFTNPTDSDLICVLLKNGITKQVHRYELVCTDIFKQKRIKLNIYCMVDIYVSSLKQWVTAYIDREATNENIFDDELCINGSNYDRWSNEIRCCSQLLSLCKDSMVYVFDSHDTQWIVGKIVRVVYKNESTQRDVAVYIVKYYKNGVKYYQYAHEFSARLAPADDVDVLSSAFFEACSVMDEHKDEQIKMEESTHRDVTDLKYHTALFEGLSDSRVSIDNNVLSVLMQYMGFNYDLAMVIESKTWSLALSFRDDIFEESSHKNVDMSLHVLGPSLYPQMKQIFETKLKERDDYTEYNVRKALQRTEQRLYSFPSITKEDAEDDSDIDTHIANYNTLPFPTQSDIDYDSSGTTVSNWSLRSGTPLDRQSDSDR